MLARSRSAGVGPHLGGCAEGQRSGRAVGAAEERGGSARGENARGGRAGTTRLPQPCGSGTRASRILTAPMALARIWNLSGAGAPLTAAGAGEGSGPAAQPLALPGPPARCRQHRGAHRTGLGRRAPRGDGARPARRCGRESAGGREVTERPTDSFGEKTLSLTRLAFFPPCFLGDRVWLPAGLTGAGGDSFTHCQERYRGTNRARGSPALSPASPLVPVPGPRPRPGPGGSGSSAGPAAPPPGRTAGAALAAIKSWNYPNSEVLMRNSLYFK